MKEYPEVFQAITLNVAWCYRACSLYSKSFCEKETQKVKFNVKICISNP